MKRFALGLVVVAAALIGTAATAPSSPARAAGSLTWTDCGRGFQCASLTVPVDYANPGGATLNLALTRLPASDPSKRIGSLLVNPGGPGASGVEFARAWAGALSSSIRQQFDIVGFDPRGIGQSTPIVCHDTLQAWIAADPVPSTQAQWDNLVAQSKIFQQACALKYGTYLQFLGTKNVARDMDQMRIALGQEKLTYLGYSYGTVIGQTYADMFPTKVRAIVLDGAVDLALSSDERTLTQIAGFELALNNYVADCKAKSCALTKRGDPIDAIDQLLAKVKQAPIPARAADRPAGPGEAFIGLITPLYSKSSWPLLTQAVDSALNGDGSALVQLTDRYLDRQADGSYANEQETNLAVNCLDGDASKLPVEFKDFPAAAAEAAKRSAHFGPAVANGLACAFWAAKPDTLPVPSAAGAPPILVVSTTGDPATPYGWGVAVSKQLKSAVLLTYNGDGHTAYLAGSGCVDNVVNAYLLELTTPAKGTECGTKAAAPGAGTPTPTAPATGASPDGGPVDPPAAQAVAPGSDDTLRWTVAALFCFGAGGALAAIAWRRMRAGS